MKRYEAEKPLLARRKREYERFLGRFGSSAAKVEAGRFRKRHPLDCGRPGCLLCHSEKVFKRRSVHQRRADEAFQSELKDLG